MGNIGFSLIIDHLLLWPWNSVGIMSDWEAENDFFDFGFENAAAPIMHVFTAFGMNLFL